MNITREQKRSIPHRVRIKIAKCNELIDYIDEKNDYLDGDHMTATYIYATEEEKKNLEKGMDKIIKEHS